MPFVSLFCILFGALIISYPEFLSYLIGFFFLFIGLNALLFSIALRRKNTSTSEKKWSVGSYEIVRRKK